MKVAPIQMNPLVTNRRKEFVKGVRQSRYLYLFLLPALVYVIIFNYLPLYGIQIAFKYYSPVKGIWGSAWIGFENFERFFESYYFGRLIKNTLGLSLYNIVAAFPFPILLALVFNEIKNQRAKKLVQTVAYVPHFISIIVLVGILNLFFMESTGLVNALRRNIGLEPVGYLNSPGLFPSMYVWSGIWQHAGWNAIIYIAALTGIDPQLHEAAQIDGATRLQRVWHVNIPCIMPTVTIMFILEVGRVMSLGFEKIYLMQNQMNIAASQVISTFVYKVGMLDMDYSFSAAVDLFNNIINVILLLSFNQLAKKIGDCSLF